MQPIPILVTQVLWLRQERSVDEVREILWSVFQEVENFYGAASLDTEFRRLSMGSVNANPRSRIPDMEATEESRSASAGQFRNTVDPLRIMKMVKARLADVPQHFNREQRTLIVTNQEITPPPQWRYNMWATNEKEGSAVVSVPPMDPRSWGASEAADADLFALKHRVRVSCLRKVGLWLGIRRCGNDSCFFFEHVESAEILDIMKVLGEEHQVELPPLEKVCNLEFVPANHPASVQELSRRKPWTSPYA